MILCGLGTIDLAYSEELRYMELSKAKSLLVVVVTAATCAIFREAVQ
jgi:hypothetical protein